MNQPRHFCKNCQRYWTAGGAMRNVPAGAGCTRSKSKSASAASHFLQRVRAALPDDPLCTPVKTNGAVLSFGSNTSTLDLTAQIKHLEEKLIPITRIKITDDPSVLSCAEGLEKGLDLKHSMATAVPVSIWLIAENCLSSIHNFRLLAGVFEPKGEAKTATHTVINSLPFLQGNPAALLRSVTFQEGS